jgi:hypothetical protein
VNLKEKSYLYVNSTIERCPNKIIEDFFPFAIVVNDSGSAPSATNISANFRKKLGTALVAFSEAWGKLIHAKT